MQPIAGANADPALAVAPPIRHTVAWRVCSVEAGPNFRLRVTFVDGTQGDVELSKFLSTPSVDDTVFQALRDAAEFAEVQVYLGAVQWKCGADLAPDAMYDAIHQHGRWVVS